MGEAASIKAQISRDVFGLFGTYLIGVTSLSILLASYGIYAFQREDFKHYKALMSTRLSFEFNSAVKQSADLAQSTQVWTGLTDSSGRGQYLVPLLTQANQNPNSQFELLDYLGRPFVQGQHATSLALKSQTNIQKTIQDSQTHLQLIQLGQQDHLSVSRPITADFSDSPIGLVLLDLDLGNIVSVLNFPEDLKVNYQLRPFDKAPELTEHTEAFVFEWRDGGKNFALHIQLQQTYWSAFKFVLAGLLLSLSSAGLLLLGLKRWTRLFSERTTLRLENLVQLASDIVQGHGIKSIDAHSGDEISKVSGALQNMLQKQQLATQKLQVFSRIFETAAEAILITNPQGLIMDVNTALTDMTGYSRQELINQPAGRLYIQDHKDLDAKIIADTVRRLGAWRGETYFLSKQQSQLPVLLSVSALLGEHGESQGHVSVFSDIRAIRDAEKKLKNLLCEDVLTGLPNYRGFLEYIHQKNGDDGFVLLFIDLDHFKNINDTFGHEQGDEVLRQTAQHLKSTLPEGNFLCRRSGDEFIAVLDVKTPWPAFQDTLKRIFEPALLTVNHLGAVQVTATFSAGAAVYPDHSSSIHELLVFADTALLFAKASGRNQIQWLNAQMMSATLRKAKVDSKLAGAIREGKITPHYQPEVDMLTGEIVGFEALARWHDEELGAVSPAEFIDLAEQSGLIDPLTQSMFQQVVHDSNAIRLKFPKAVISFNSSPQLLAGKRLFTILSALAADLENGLDAFVLEITESDFGLSPQELSIQLQSIMGLGLRIAIDDFGKSYSSLSRLSTLPIQKLKIDMSFTAGLDRKENEKIVLGILALAQSMELEVTSEGVETRFQRDTLLRLGCRQAQGFFYSKPMPLAALLLLPSHLLID